MTLTDHTTPSEKNSWHAPRLAKLSGTREIVRRSRVFLPNSEQSSYRFLNAEAEQRTTLRVDLGICKARKKPRMTVAKSSLSK